MGTDFTTQIAQQTRALRIEGNDSDEDATLAVTIQRTLPGSSAQVWDTITTPEQVTAWFQPLSGDLREGGDYTLEGLDSGTILACQAPQLLRVSFGGADSIVTVELAAGDTAETTDLRVEHRVPLAVAGSPTAAFFIGTAWDANTINLATWLKRGVRVDAFAQAQTALFVALIDVWHAVIRDTGTMDDETLRAAADGTRHAFTTPSPAPVPDASA